MKNIVSFLFLAILFHSCDNRQCANIEGPRVSRTMSIEDSPMIALDMVATVNLKTDSLQEISAERIAQEEMQSQIQFLQDSSTFHISLNRCFREHLPVTINLNLPAVNEIQVLSAGDLNTEGIIRQDSIKIFSDGLGTIDAAFLGDYAEIETRQSGDVIVKGQAREALFEVIGSGLIEAYNLQVEDVRVNSFSLGVIEVYASRVLRIDFIKPGGTVKYRGTPQAILVTGVGDVIDDNL